MITDPPKPKILLEEAITRAISASGYRSDELVGVHAILLPQKDAQAIHWDIGVEPASMRFLEPHFIRIQIDAETGAASVIEMR